jgi:hypothetical protein
MSRVKSVSRATLLLAGLSIWGLSPANADTTVTLEGVTFADGATASGSFMLNADGYLEAADITTTPGTSIGGLPLAGYTYTLANSDVPNGSAPFDSVFYFNSTADAFGLILIAAFPVTEGGVDPLIVGDGSGGSLVVSNEYCTENPIACGGVAYDDGRLVSAGTLYAPEPATLSLLGLGALVVPLLRRGRTKTESGAA